jgi:hypothetical protein
VDESELSGLLDTLERSLAQTALSSLVDQERVAAAEGTIVELTEDQVAEVRRQWSALPGRAPHVEVGEIRTRPLTSAERLAGLLDLLETSIGGSYAIEAHLRDDIKAALDPEISNWTGGIIFAAPPGAAGVADRWELPDQSVLHQRAHAVSEVILLIDQLREQAGLMRSSRLAAVTDQDPDRGDRQPVPGDWS